MYGHRRGVLFGQRHVRDLHQMVLAVSFRQNGKHTTNRGDNKEAICGRTVLAVLAQDGCGLHDHGTFAYSHPTMEEVKQLVARTFIELGATDAFNLRETLFLEENGRCLAVAYRADDFNAVWCWADQIIEFRNAEGKVLRTLSLPEEARSSSEVA